jgi:hypothetical protein
MRSNIIQGRRTTCKSCQTAQIGSGYSMLQFRSIIDSTSPLPCIESKFCFSGCLLWIVGLISIYGSSDWQLMGAVIPVVEISPSSPSPSSLADESIRSMSKGNTKQRVYLAEEEKNILASLLDEWNNKPNKKIRDAFIMSEALPKIQALNPSQYGAEIISKDKAAKSMWERRVQVMYRAYIYNII